jgi:hypothetical protein
MATKMSKAMYGKTMMKKDGTKKPLRKAQDGIEMNDDMINKSGSTGGYKKPMKIVRGASAVDRMYSDTTPGELPLMMMKKPTGYTKPTGYKKGGMTMKKMYKTGGMVNSNTKLVAAKSAGSKGVKAGVNPKAAASSTAKKPSKPRSKAPKKAVPQAKYGMAMKGKSC